MEVHSADGTAYRAHGLVLMAGSDYFAAAYTGGWKESSGPHVLCAVSAEALEACFEWIYTGACVVADDQALLEILQAATYLQIAPLIAAAMQVIQDRLGPNTALPVWRIAHRYDAEELEQLAVTMLCRNFRLRYGRSGGASR